MSSASEAPGRAGSATPHVAADPVELFFDLAYVFALARLVGIVHADHSALGLARAAVLLGLLWWAWSQFTWAANAAGASRRGVRATFLAGTVLTIPLAAAMPEAYGGTGAVLAVTWAGLMLLGFTMFGVGVGADAARRRAVWRLLRRCSPAITLAVVAGVVAAPGPRLALWATVLVLLVVAVAVGGDGFEVIPSHFAERHGLFVILALGEAVVGIGVAVGGHVTDAGALAALLAAGLLAALLWWAYFDRIAPAAEARLHGREGSARAHLARDLYTLLHLPIVAGVLLVAVVLEEVAAHPADPLGPGSRGLLACGLLLVLGAFVAGSRRAGARTPSERIAGLVALLALLAAAGPLTGLAVVVVIDVVLALALLAEERRAPRVVGP